MNDKLNGADTGAHDELADDLEAPEPDTQSGTASEAAGPTAAGGTAGATTGTGGRFGIRRGRTRAEERISELDTSPATLSAELDAMRARTETAEAELAEARTGWQRSAADFQNYRRRTEQERAGNAAFASEGLLRKVLAIADDFDRASGHAPSDPAASAWVEGVTAIDRKVRLLLESEGVTAIDALGQPFDPRRHEAIIHEPTNEFPDGTVVKELQKGYELNSRVIRPALVAVADNANSMTTTDGAGAAPQSEDQD